MVLVLHIYQPASSARASTALPAAPSVLMPCPVLLSHNTFTHFVPRCLVPSVPRLHFLVLTIHCHTPHAGRWSIFFNLGSLILEIPLLPPKQIDFYHKGC